MKMLNQFTALRWMAIVFLCLSLAGMARAQRHMEKLGRGVVAVRSSSTQVYIGWRLLGNDPEDIAFNLYRSANGGAAVKVNGSPLAVTTDYSDTPGNLSTTAYTYSVKPVIGGVEVPDVNANPLSPSFTLPANTTVGANGQYLSVPLQPVSGYPTEPTNAAPYDVKFAWVGDLDGDGEYEIVVDRISAALAQDVHQCVDAYKRDGTFLWRVDQGSNSINAANSQFESRPSTLSEGNWDGVAVYDMDGDGKAEVMIKSANGVVFGNGQTLNVPGAGPDAQFISILNGLTGAEIARAPWPADFISDGPMGMGFSIACLDGITPSLVVKAKNRQPSGAFNQIVAAFHFDGTNFTQQWKSIRNDGSADGHQFRISDLNDDGKDEYLDIGIALKSDGTSLYNLTTSAGILHGDRQHITDIDPDRPGLEVFSIQQLNPSLLATEYFEAATGKIIKKWFSGGVVDVGRGMVVDINPDHKGCEFFSTQPGIFDCKGNQIYANSVFPTEGLWWDADLGREFVYGAGGNGETASTINGFDQVSGTVGRILSLYKDNVHSAYGGRAALGADILGDWREEVIVVANDFNSLHIYTTTTAATNRIYTLMQDPQYRSQTTIKGYVEASYVDYYLGWGMTPPPPPPAINSKLVWRGGAGNVWDNSTANWRTNWFYVFNSNTVPAVCNSGDSVLFDTSGSNNTAIAITGALTPGDVTVYAFKDFTFDGSLGSLGGAMKLTKVGVGQLTITGNHSFTNKTVVWDGALLVSGNLQNSPVTVWGGTWGGALAAGKTGGRLAGAGTFSQPVTIKYRGAITPGNGMNSPGTINFGSGLTLESDSTLALDLSDDPTGTTKTNDLINITGNLTLTGTNHIVINCLNTNLPPGTIYPLINYSGTFSGGLGKFDISGVTRIPVALTNPPGQIALVVKNFRVPGTITWTGGQNGNTWDLLITTNWLNGGVKDQFAPNDTVRFDDSGATNLTANLSGDLNCAGIVVDSATNYTLTGSGAIIGSASLTKTNSGTLTVNTLNNTFTGKTIVAGGTLVVSELDAVGFPSPLGNSPGGATNLVLSGNATLRITAESYTDRGMTINAGTNTIDIPNGSDQLTLAGVITGSGALQKIGNGTVSFTLNNTYTGNTYIRGGGVSLGGGTVNQYGFGPGPGGNGNTTVVLENSTLTMFSDTSSYDTCYWNLIIPTNTTANFYVDARCDLYGKWTNSGTLNYYTYYIRSGLDGDWSASTGVFNIISDSGGGDFRIQNTFGYPNATINLGANTSIYHASGGAVSIGAVSGSSGSSMNGTPWTVGAKNIDMTYAGNITGNSITKVGTGTWTLSGTNSYTGATIISGGTLLINGNAAPASGAITVAAAGTLGGSGTIGGATTVNGKLSPGNNVIGTLTFSNNVTLAAGSTTLMEINRNTSAFDVANVSGTLNCGGTLLVTNLAGTLAYGDSFKIFNATTIAGSFTSLNLPSLATNLAWNTSALYTSGTISIGVVGPPAAPVLTATPGDSQVSLAWNVSSGATNYILQSSTTNDGPYSMIATTNGTSFLNTGLTNGVTYYYVVAAVGVNGQSPFSAQASATPNTGIFGNNWTNTLTATAQNWNADSNWSGGTFPNSAAATAVVGSGIAGNQTVNLNQAITVGTLAVGAAGGAFNVTGNGGALTLDNSPNPALLLQVAASSGDTVSAPLTNAGALLVQNDSANTLNLSGVISGGGSNITFNGDVTLASANTFSNATFLATGTLRVANTLALQNSTLNYNGGSLAFSGVTTCTLGGLSGTNNFQNLTLTNTTGSAVALTVGGNNAQTVYGGGVSGSGSIIKTGSSSLTLSNANHTGSTTVGLGTLNISGGNFGNASSSFAVQGNSGSSTTAFANVNGGTFNAGSVNIATSGSQFGATLTINGNANATFATGFTMGGASTAGSLTVNTTGNVSLGAAAPTRDGGGGLIIQNGNVTATSVDVKGTGSSGTANANLSISGGSLTIGNSSSTGAFKVGDTTQSGNGHGGALTMSGGALTYLGTDGLLLGANGTGGLTEHGNATISGGVAKLSGVNLNAANISDMTSILTVNGAAQPALYLGAAGLVTHASSATVSATFGNAIIGALTNWSSIAPITLMNGSNIVFQAADDLANPWDITLGGVLSGTGSLTKSGSGVLVLNGVNTYNGATTVGAGRLSVNGSLTVASVVTVNSGGALGGSGVIAGMTTINPGGTLAPGNSIGTLTFGNSLTLVDGCTNIFELSKSPLTNDVAKVLGALTNGGLLIVTNVGAIPLAAGDTFKLLNAASYHDAFENLVLPPLPAGLAWNTDALNTNGTLAVVVASQPVFGSVFLTGSGLVLSGSGGVANANYYLLGASNLMSPLAAWARLLTNQFDNNGNFNFTNPPNPDWPQGFYRLQAP